MKNIIKIAFLPFLLYFSIAHAMAEDSFFDFKGSPADIQSYLGKGKWTVVMFWASDCLICNKEAHQYVKFHEEHKNKDARILGISLDGIKNIKSAKSFVKDNAVTFDNLIAEPEVVAGFYYDQTGDTWYGTPTFLIYAPDGKLKAAQSGAVPPKLIEDYINKNSK